MKLFFTALFLVIVSSAFSQSLVLSGGGSFALIDYNQGSGSQAIDENFTGPGFHAGGFLESPLIKKRKEELVLTIGLLADYKMTKQTYTEFDRNNKLSLLYANVPLYLSYRYKMRSRSKIYIGAGPYAGMGLSGKYTYILFENQASENEKIKWGSNANEDDLKRLDYGVSVKAGYRAYRGLDVALSFDLGIPDVYTRFDSQSMKHRAIRLSIGYALDLAD